MDSIDEDEEAKMKCVQSFLKRHGFVDASTPREGYAVIQMKPVYAIDVARDLGNEEIVMLLSEQTSKPNAPRAVGDRSCCLGVGCCQPGCAAYEPLRSVML